MTTGSHAVAALGSTSNFELPAEELEKFTQDHSMNGGGAASNSTEDDEDDYTESLVYVSSPKVGYLQCIHACLVGVAAQLIICKVGIMLQLSTPPKMRCWSTITYTMHCGVNLMDIQPSVFMSVNMQCLDQQTTCGSRLLGCLQVGILRRGKYFKGKKVGKGMAVNEVCP